jgi:DNA-binding NtrC family response regulator
MSWPGTLHATDDDRASGNQDDSMGNSRFSTLTPTSMPGERCSVTPAGAGSPDAPITVLVIDDDPRVRTALGQTIALESDLVVVAAAGDTSSALAWAERADPAVSLVDVFLPDEAAGLALISQLARRSGRTVVAMSVRGGLRSAALAAGAASFVEKSGDIDAVLDAVRAAASPRHT